MKSSSDSPSSGTPFFPTLHFDTQQMTETTRTEIRDWVFGEFQSPVTFDVRSKRMTVQINDNSLGVVPEIRRRFRELGGLEVTNDEV